MVGNVFSEKEEAFESAFGYPIDEEDRPGGDGNVDFNTPVGTVDVKTARKPYHLLVEVGKPQADIIVLAEYLPDIKMAVLIGWEYSEYVQRTPVKRFHKDGPQNHYIRAEYLRPMKELDALIRDVGKNSIKAK